MLISRMYYVLSRGTQAVFETNCLDSKDNNSVYRNFSDRRKAINFQVYRTGINILSCHVNVV